MSTISSVSSSLQVIQLYSSSRIQLASMREIFYSFSCTLSYSLRGNQRQGESGLSKMMPEDEHDSYRSRPQALSRTCFTFYLEQWIEWGSLGSMIQAQGAPVMPKGRQKSRHQLQHSKIDRCQNSVQSFSRLGSFLPWDFYYQSSNTLLNIQNKSLGITKSHYSFSSQSFCSSSGSQPNQLGSSILKQLSISIELGPILFFRLSITFLECSSLPSMQSFNFVMNSLMFWKLVWMPASPGLLVLRELLATFDYILRACLLGYWASKPVLLIWDLRRMTDTSVAKSSISLAMIVSVIFQTFLFRSYYSTADQFVNRSIGLISSLKVGSNSGIFSANCYRSWAYFCPAADCLYFLPMLPNKYSSSSWPSSAELARLPLFLFICTSTSTNQLKSFISSYLQPSCYQLSFRLLFLAAQSMVMSLYFLSFWLKTQTNSLSYGSWVSARFYWLEKMSAYSAFLDELGDFLACLFASQCRCFSSAALCSSLSCPCLYWRSSSSSGSTVQ